MHSSPVRRTRRVIIRFARPAIGGALLAGLLLFGLMVVSDPHDLPPPDEWSVHPGALTGRQPALPQHPAPATTAAPPPGEVVAASPRPSPAAAAPSTPPEQAPDCRALWEEPATLLTALSATSTRSRHAEHHGAVLHHVRARFDRGQATRAFESLAHTAAGCGEFTAALGDDRAATVRLAQVQSLGTDSYVAAVTAVDQQFSGTGWWVLQRSGPVVSVLLHVHPDDFQVDGPPHLRRAAAALVSSLPDLGDELGELLFDLP